MLIKINERKYVDHDQIAAVEAEETKGLALSMGSSPAYVNVFLRPTLDKKADNRALLHVRCDSIEEAEAIVVKIVEAQRDAYEKSKPMAPIYYKLPSYVPSPGSDPTLTGFISFNNRLYAAPSCEQPAVDSGGETGETK